MEKDRKKLFLIMGLSGTGKTHITEKVSEETQLKTLKSYTTREERNDGIDYKSHTFITKEEFNKKLSNKELLAYTEYAGEGYGADLKMLEDADLYVLDDKGVYTLMENKDKLDKDIVLIYIYTSNEIRKQHMLNRGDTLKEIVDRFVYELHNNDFKDVEDFLTKNHPEVGVVKLENNGSLGEIVEKFKEVVLQ